MQYSPPGGASANFFVGVSGIVYTATDLNIVYLEPSGYVAPYGQAVEFSFPGEYHQPVGNAAHFDVPIPPVIGVGVATVGFVAAGAGKHGVSGLGAAVVPFSATGYGVTEAPAYSGVGVATVGIFALGHGSHVAPPPVTTRRVSSAVTNHWVRSITIRDERVATHVAAATRHVNRAAPWSVGRDARNSATSRWRKVAQGDRITQSRWGKYAIHSAVSSTHLWHGAKPVDRAASYQWGKFGALLRRERGTSWHGSVPCDAIKNGKWYGYWIPLYRTIPYPPSLGNSADFNVAGGGADFYLDLVSPFAAASGNAISLSFPAGTYAPPVIVYPEYVYTPPRGVAADFLYHPARERVYDASGHSVMAPSGRQNNGNYPWGLTARADSDTWHPWNSYSRYLGPGWGVVIPGEPPTPPGQSIIIPVRRAYIVVNEILLTRVADNTPIPASALSIQFDCDSWLPSFSATIPESARDAVMPDPDLVEIYAFINGSEFRFFVENIARSRQFAQRSVTISGRGIACELGAPFAAATQHINTSAMNAQQLIDAALEFTGYTQTWHIADWLVPAGAFNLFGTPADVAGQIAEASGSVLAADWLARDLRMLPRYPVKPWEWAAATPDYVIPSAVTQTESLEWIEKPSYNVVYVSGVETGVLGQVKIAGTAGDKPAPMVTHQLITHSDAARQRGVSILSDTGRKAMMQLSMPVLESTGVIDLCKLVEFSDGAATRRGIVRANQVSASWPTVRQTLTIEAAA